MPPLFDQHFFFDPAGDLGVFLKQVPARPAVCLLADGQDHPVQLLAVRNLRAALQRRLGESAAEEPKTKRLDYRALVRQVHWQRVGGDFEADLVYLEAARRLFPDTYPEMTGVRLPWWVRVDPGAEFPRYVKTTDPCGQGGLIFGPLQEKQGAARLIEQVEDLFDLCRYHHILVQAPRGKACAYKEMGKCPAPCDGSIPMESYRRMMAQSAEMLTDLPAFIARQEERMRQAAAELRFEAAAQAKSLLERAGALGRGPFRHVRPLERFCFLTLQPAPEARGRAVQLFLIVLGQIHVPLALLDYPADPLPLIELLRQSAADLDSIPLDPSGVERMALVAHHLFAARRAAGAPWIPLADLSPAKLRAAWRQVQKQPAPAGEDAAESWREG